MEHSFGGGRQEARSCVKLHRSHPITGSRCDWCPHVPEDRIKPESSPIRSWTGVHLDTPYLVFYVGLDVVANLCSLTQYVGSVKGSAARLPVFP